VRKIAVTKFEDSSQKGAEPFRLVDNHDHSDADDSQQGKYEDAAKNLEKSLSLKKDFPAANYELGVAYNALGRNEDAQKQLSILQSSGSSQAQELQFILEKPQILYMDQGQNRHFNQLLGPTTQLYQMEDSTLLQAGEPSLANTPGVRRQISVAIQFNNEMDAASVMNPANWEISRAGNAEAGYYIADNTGRDVKIAKAPLFVTYDSETRQASVSFIVQQVSGITLGEIPNKGATIDPSHLVFKFSGIDAAGRQMDTAGDEIDGAALKAF